MASNVKHAKVSAKADGADATEVRASDWNAAHEGALEIYDRDLVQDKVESSTTEESVYSIEIPADLLGATGGFRLTLGGDMLKNAVGDLTLNIRFDLTATALLSRQIILTTDALTIDSVASNTYKWRLVLECLNSDASNQKWVAEFDAINSAYSMGTQLGDDSKAVHSRGYAASAEDTTAANTLDFLALWTASSASLSFRCEFALLELLPPA